MKTILLLLTVVATFGCMNLKPVQQVDMVLAKLVKVDTIYRYPKQIQQLTWEDDDQVQYICYVPMQSRAYAVGSSVYVMRKR